MRVQRQMLVIALWLATVSAAAAETPAGAPQRGSAAVSAGQASPLAHGLLPPRSVDALKSGVAVAGTALLLFGALRRLRHREGSRTSPRSRGFDMALATLGLVGGLGWWNLLQFHYPGFHHPRDNFHYYLGAKYFPELAYTRLYACAAIADREAGLRTGERGGRIRNLASNQLESAHDTLAHPELCKRHFSPQRWRDFTRDVGWMRDRIHSNKWNAIFLDHGYNGTPAWGILGGTLSNASALSFWPLRALTLLDPLLQLSMWASFVWAFGWRAACVGLLFWGTNYFSPFTWTGGGILRQDWLAASVVGIALLKKGRPMAAGFLLTWAALLRIFPALILAGVALKVLAGFWERRSFALESSHRRIALGALLCLALAIPLSALTVGRGDSAGSESRGLGVWLDFYENSRVHLSTPLRNHMGLQTLLAHDSASTSQKLRDRRLEDPFEPWKQARRENFSARRPAFLVLVVAFAAFLAHVVRQREDWVAAVLGIGLIPIATELTSYYLCILLGFAALASRRNFVGAALVGLSALSWGIVEIWHWYDEIFTWLSLAVAAFVVLATASELRPPSHASGRET